MAINREKKEQLVAKYQDDLSRSNALFFTDYRGLTVSDFEALRAKIREAGGGYSVVKNTLAAIALKEAGLTVPDEILDGPVAMSFAFEEAPALAKALSDFAKKTEILEVKGGLLDGDFLAPEQVAALANLPSRDVIMAQLLGLIQQPGNQVAGVINATGNKLAATIKAHADELQSAQAAT